LESEIILSRSWLSSERLEDALRTAPLAPHASDTHEVTFTFPVGCKIIVDAAIRLLSLANQLSLATRRVKMKFEEGDLGVMGYLNRIGFFDHLAPTIEVHPERPAISTANLYRGSNHGLVEIAQINRQLRDKQLPNRLRDALIRGYGHRSDAEEVGDAAWTIFAELIDNIFSHSDTALDGFAVLQVYPNGKRITIAVSDSGKGIMETIRPTLKSQNPKLNGLSDLNLLVEMLRKGLSRHGTDRGLGLKGCAQKAIRYNADLDIRLPTQRVLLKPALGTYRPNTASCYENIPLMWGTHIAFGFRLG
jgi:hypothetical protein